MLRIYFLSKSVQCATHDFGGSSVPFLKISYKKQKRQVRTGLQGNGEFCQKLSERSW